MTDWPDIQLAVAQNSAGYCVVCECNACADCTHTVCAPRTGFYAATFYIECDTQFPGNGNHFYEAVFDGNFWGSNGGDQHCFWYDRDGTIGEGLEICGFRWYFDDDYDHAIFPTQAAYLASKGIILGGQVVNQIYTYERTDDHSTAQEIYVTIFSDEISVDMVCEEDSLGCAYCVVDNYPEKPSIDLAALAASICAGVTQPCYRWARYCEYDCTLQTWVSISIFESSDCDAASIVYLDDPTDCYAIIYGTIYHNPPGWTQIPLNDPLPSDPEADGSIDISLLPDTSATCCFNDAGRYKCKYILDDSCDWTYDSSVWLFKYIIDPVTHLQIENPDYESGPEAGYYDGECIFYILGPEHDDGDKPSSEDCDTSFLPEDTGVTFDGIAWDNAGDSNWSDTVYAYTDTSYTSLSATLTKASFCVGTNGLYLNIGLNASLDIVGAASCGADAEIPVIHLADVVYLDGTPLVFSDSGGDIYGTLTGDDCIATQYMTAEHFCIPCGTHTLVLEINEDASGGTSTATHTFTVENDGNCPTPPELMKLTTKKQTTVAVAPKPCGGCKGRKEQFKQAIEAKKQGIITNNKEIT